ncbi:MAG TPA: hypothetical protein VGC75_03025 [Candidatus Nitrosocosmicus sp.]
MNINNSIKDEIKQRYSKIAIMGNSDSCCMPSLSECCNTDNIVLILK